MYKPAPYSPSYLTDVFPVRVVVVTDVILAVVARYTKIRLAPVYIPTIRGFFFYSDREESFHEEMETHTQGNENDKYKGTRRTKMIRTKEYTMEMTNRKGNEATKEG